jgi:DNA (cytosine-5)-methyltransferase 1
VPGRPGLSDYSDVPTYDRPFGSFVSLYAGAGGMDIGFALAGFEPVWVNELDAQAMATHERAFKRLADERPHLSTRRWVGQQGDLLAIRPDELPAKGFADLVIGGPPCQGFSVAGKMNPEDERSRHVFHFMDIVARVEPRAFVLENVKALYASARWEAVRRRLTTYAESLGYSWRLDLLDASRFGVPQARERMLLIGVRHRVPVAPRPTTAEAPPTLRDALAQLPRVGELGNDSRCPAKVTPARSPVLRRSPYAGMLFNGAGRPMDLDAPAPTVPASMGGNKTPIIDQDQLDHSTPPWIVSYHSALWRGQPPVSAVPPRMRRITVEEAAAIQTFPLGMEWCGPQSSQYRQIGNAVPPRLALAAAESIKESLGLR